MQRRAQRDVLLDTSDDEHGVSSMHRQEGRKSHSKEAPQEARSMGQDGWAAQKSVGRTIRMSRRIQPHCVCWLCCFAASGFCFL